MTKRAVRSKTKTVDQYIPKIEDGIPIPKPVPTAYSKRVVAGELIRIADRIKPNQSVKLPQGSIAKFKRRLESRGLKAVYRQPNSGLDLRVWVIKGP